MNKEAILKHTASYEDNLIERLKDPELAQNYLETAVESYEREGNNVSGKMLCSCWRRCIQQ